MDAHRDIAKLIAGGRILMGGALAVAPGPASRGWIGRDAERAGAKVMTRGLGARDLALGAGVLSAIASEKPVRAWLAASALSDAADFMATLIAGDDLPRAARVSALAVAGTAAVACAAGAALADE